MKIEDLKVGDELVLLNQLGWASITKGNSYKISKIEESSLLLQMGTRVNKLYLRDFELVEDRSTWHPHHDEIVAWAKGAEIQYEWGSEWLDANTPQWKIDKRYRVKPEPDNTAEIAEIEQEMLKLADRLEKLKRE